LVGEDGHLTGAPGLLLCNQCHVERERAISELVAYARHMRDELYRQAESGAYRRQFARIKRRLADDISRQIKAVEGPNE
jgi:hypothetical protein